MDGFKKKELELEQEKPVVKMASKQQAKEAELYAPDLEKELNKLLRKPRSRRFSKAVREADVPSVDDQALMERLKQERGIAAEEEVVFTPQDMEAFRQEIAQKVAEDIAREEAEERRMEEERLNCVLEDIVCKCGLSGYYMHSITQEGRIRHHYLPEQYNSLAEKYQLAATIIENHYVDQWTYVEVYGRRLVHRNNNGDTLGVYPVEEGSV